MYLVSQADNRHHEGMQEGIAHTGAQEAAHHGLQQGCHEAAAAAATAAGEPAPQVQLEHQGDQALVGGASPLQVLRLQRGQCPASRYHLSPSQREKGAKRGVGNLGCCWCHCFCCPIIVAAVAMMLLLLLMLCLVVVAVAAAAAVPRQQMACSVHKFGCEQCYGAACSCNKPDSLDSQGSCLSTSKAKGDVREGILSASTRSAAVGRQACSSRTVIHFMRYW